VPLPAVNPTGELAPPWLLGLLYDNWTLALLAYATTIVAGFVRFLRSRGDERQQIKWLAYLGLLALVFNLAGLLLPEPARQLGSIVGLTLIMLSGPVAAGLAILRYRLYDIDRLITRTLVYALLSGALSFVYFTSVALLQQVIPGQSPLVIVASTLLMAVLFAPLRSRIQAVIDRRFHRRRYDAQRILQAFSAAARDEVNLDRLRGELQAAVQQSLEPASVSLWLRERPSPRPELLDFGMDGDRRTADDRRRTGG
jgi:hypothetical protein